MAERGGAWRAVAGRECEARGSYIDLPGRTPAHPGLTTSASTGSANHSLALAPAGCIASPRLAPPRPARFTPPCTDQTKSRRRIVGAGVVSVPTSVLIGQRCKTFDNTLQPVQPPVHRPLQVGMAILILQGKQPTAALEYWCWG